MYTTRIMQKQRMSFFSRRFWVTCHSETIFAKKRYTSIAARVTNHCYNEVIRRMQVKAWVISAAVRRERVDEGRKVLNSSRDTHKRKRVGRQQSLPLFRQHGWRTLCTRRRGFTLQWLVVALQWVRVSVRVYRYIPGIILRVCQPCCRKSGKVMGGEGGRRHKKKKCEDKNNRQGERKSKRKHTHVVVCSASARMYEYAVLLAAFLIFFLHHILQNPFRLFRFLFLSICLIFFLFSFFMVWLVLSCPRILKFTPLAFPSALRLLLPWWIGTVGFTLSDRLWPHNLYLSRMKNQHKHWVYSCRWVEENGLMRRQHTITATNTTRYSAERTRAIRSSGE